MEHPTGRDSYRVGRASGPKKARTGLHWGAWACEPRTRERAFCRDRRAGRVSPGVPEALQRQASELGLNDKILFLGDRPDVPRLLAGLIFPCGCRRARGCRTSSPKGGGGPARDRHADGGTPQQITDGISGLFVEHENPLEVAGTIVGLMDEPDLRFELGNALREHVVLNYSAEAVIPQWERLFARLRGP